MGLRIHPDKTKILSNQSTINSDTQSILKLMTWISKYWPEMKAWNIQVRKSRSSNKKRQKSRAVSGLHGWPSTDTDKSWHRKATCSNIVYGFFDATVSPTVCYVAGTWATKNTKECFSRRNARCYDSSSRQKGNTKRLGNKILGPKKKMKKLTSMKCVALMMKAETARAQRPKMTWTVKFHLKTMPTMRLIQLWLKKKTGLNT